ncbi:hypothetical protein SAMN06297144_0216 [Sphingomonas guangdongensis]|uniref:Uncharacterized protein n=2 Tax=Sphingomonas guangdongensis TaxID=1141890 RepID=A0A285QA32_9SPHN|nr:hypothetical protein SAMN06297144_0216 [Sphingomonas guangdongensis]
MIFEGGDGDDKIVIVGSAKGGVLVRGGAGRDSITLESHWTWLAHQIGMPGFVILGTATIMLAVVLTICWRALKQER